MALQLGAMLFLGIWLGKKLDAYFALNKPVFTIFLLLLFFIGFMVSVYYDLNRKDNE